MKFKNVVASSVRDIKWSFRKLRIGFFLFKRLEFFVNFKVQFNSTIQDHRSRVRLCSSGNFDELPVSGSNNLFCP